MTHDDLRELSGLYVLGALDDEDRVRFEAHLRECAICAAEVDSFRPVVDRLAEASAVQAAVPAALRARVLADGPRDADASVPMTPGDDAAREPTAIPPELDPARASSWPWLAAAAALVVALLTGWSSMQVRTRIEALETRLEVTLDRAAVAESRLVELEQTSQRADTTAAILVAADLARVELRGEDPAPDARARAFWSRANGLVITADSLPALPEGQVYQLWVVTADAAISAGLLQPDQQGRVTAVIVTPPDLPQPEAMAVTVEPAGGVPAPTGERVLIGTPATSL